MAPDRLTVEEAGLAEIRVEALHALVAQAEDRHRPTDRASYVVVIGVFRMYDPMKNGQPNQRLRLSLHPAEEVAKFDLIFVGTFQARSDREINDRSAERSGLSQVARNLQETLEQICQPLLVHQTVGVRDQLKQDCKARNMVY